MRRLPTSFSQPLVFQWGQLSVMVDRYSRAHRIYYGLVVTTRPQVRIKALAFFHSVEERDKDALKRSKEGQVDNQFMGDFVGRAVKTRGTARERLIGVVLNGKDAQIVFEDHDMAYLRPNDVSEELVWCLHGTGTGTCGDGGENEELLSSAFKCIQERKRGLGSPYQSPFLNVAVRLGTCGVREEPGRVLIREPF